MLHMKHSDGRQRFTDFEIKECFIQNKICTKRKIIALVMVRFIWQIEKWFPRFNLIARSFRAPDKVGAFPLTRLAKVAIASAAGLVAPHP